MDNRSSRPASLILAGVVKSGSTSLFSMLAQHPALCPSAVKETSYFLPARYGEKVAPPDNYWPLFDMSAEHKFLLEATPGYLYGGDAVIEAMQPVVSPDSKVIVLLRDPVRRAISFYRYRQAMLELDADLELDAYIQQCLELDDQALGRRDNSRYFAVQGGMYSQYLGSWIDAFGDNLKVLFTEDLKNDPATTLASVFAWLGIDTSWTQPILEEFESDNVTTGYRSRSLQALAIAVNKKFESLLRNNMTMKRQLRGLYYALNGRRVDKVGSQEATVALLDDVFARDKRILRPMLEAHGVSRFPDWLQGSTGFVESD